MKVEFAKNKPTVAGLAALCGGRLHLPAGSAGAGTAGETVLSVCTDSREASPGCAFAAIPGEKVDGHDYIARAEAGGCCCAVASHIPDAEITVPLILVNDTVAALGRLAAAYGKGSARVTAVTGSVGKTTTKEFIASVLGAGHRVYRTEGNFNSVIGMPLSLLAMPGDAEFAVFEMGMSARGEISSMSLAAKPDIAVITNIGSSHLEFLGSRENIAAAKLEIADGLAPDGVLLMCAGEPLLAGAYADDRRARTFTAEDIDADYRALNIRTDASGTQFDADCRGTKLYDLEIPVIGKHNVAAAVSAVAVGMICGLDSEAIRRGLAAYRPAAMRQQILRAGRLTVIKDCYNASPESMRAACEVLRATARGTGGRRLALLGDMLELGGQSRELHRATGEYFASQGLDRLYTLGQRAEAIADGAAETGMPAECIFRTPAADDYLLAARAIAADALPGDVLLIKASRGIAAERVADALQTMIGE